MYIRKNEFPATIGWLTDTLGIGHIKEKKTVQSRILHGDLFGGF